MIWLSTAKHAIRQSPIGATGWDNASVCVCEIVCAYGVWMTMNDSCSNAVGPSVCGKAHNRTMNDASSHAVLLLLTANPVRSTNMHIPFPKAWPSPDHVENNNAGLDSQRKEGNPTWSCAHGITKSKLISIMKWCANQLPSDWNSWTTKKHIC